MKKSPINIDYLQGETQPPLYQACLDFLFLEHQAQREDRKTHIIQHIEQRLQTGESVFVKIDDIYMDEKTGNYTLTASVDYSSLPYTEPDRVLSSLRHKESGKSSSGEFVMGIPINRRGEPTVGESLSNIYEYPRFVIEEINMTEISKGRANIKMSLGQGQNKKLPFIYNKPWVKPGQHDTGIQPGDLYILDPSIDDYTAASAYQVLQNDQYNSMTSIIEDILYETFDNESTLYDKEKIDSFINWMHNEDPETITPSRKTDRSRLPTTIHGPNKEQTEFIKDVETEISLLQGPPGTGKTSGAVAPAILARIISHQGDTSPCRTAVTGPSNKAINEIMDKTLRIATACTESDKIDADFTNTLFIRLSEDPNLEHDPMWDNIIHTPLYSGEQTEDLIPHIRSRLGTSTITPNTDEHIIVFGTARRIWKLGKKIIDPFVYTEEGDKNSQVNIDDNQISRSHQLFDNIVVDEASMMTLSDFLTVGAFYSPGGNILISGDHRQLPPVHQHDWETEYKPSIVQVPPFLSVLDFYRYLQGDIPEKLDKIQKQLLYEPNQTTEIPMHQLETTYRCHETVAQFLKKWVYKNLDDLQYHSNRTDTIDAPQTNSEALQTILDPTHPFTLVTYPEGNSQQSNVFEAWLTTLLVEAYDDPKNTGVVTPHNAQRGLINIQLNTNAKKGNSIEIDTVERFQGGEKELMILNGTVSDPDYVDSESDFLLNLNRLNVSVSRMEKKCIVIASEAIFNHIPLERTKYNDTLLWKGLANESGLANGEQPHWKGDLTNEVPTQPSTKNPIPEISVYHIE